MIRCLISKRAARFAVLWLALGTLSVSLAAAGLWSDPRDLEYPPLGTIQTPEIQRHVLEENGLVILMTEDHDFPMVDFRAMVHVGSIYEPQPLRGLAELTGKVLRTGGTQSISGDELDARLEALGAAIESSIGANEGIVNGSFLAEDALAGVAFLADVLRNPAFAEDKIALARIDMRTQISARNDEQFDIAFREFVKLMYGANSPYGWHPEYETVDAITRDDIAGFHRAYFHPDRMILTVAGDFEPAAMLAAIRSAFADWPRSQQPLPPDPAVPNEGPSGVHYAEKKGVTQSTVLFGLLGILASDPDYAELRLLNQILGEGFSGRLVNEIRTKRGLAYAVGSAPGVGWHHRGTWLAYVMTASESTVVAMKALHAEIERVVNESVTEEELQRAKDIELNQLVFDLATRSAVLNRQAHYEFYGYPPDFLQRYQEQIPKLTAQDLLAAARRHIKPDAMAALVVGLREDFRGSLEDLGPVSEVDISIPEPAARFVAPPATDASLKEGRAQIAAATQAHHAARLAQCPSLRTEGNGTLNMMGQTMDFTHTVVRAFPDREWTEMLIGGMFRVTTAVDGERGWRKTPQGVETLSGDELEEALRDTERSVFNLLREHGSLEWQSLGEADFDGTPCQVLYIPNATTQEWRVYVDKSNHLIRGMRFRGRGQQGPVEVEERYRDYRPVDGLMVAHDLAILHDGEQIVQIRLSAVQLGGVVDETIFAQPEQ